MQLWWPEFTSRVYIDGELLRCCSDGTTTTSPCVPNTFDTRPSVLHAHLPPLDSGECVLVGCASQGPFSLIQQVMETPGLMLNGILALIFHMCEVLLFKSVWGVLLKPLAAMLSAALVLPVEGVFGLDTGNHAIRTVVLILGMAGGLFASVSASQWNKLRLNLRNCFGFPPDNDREESRSRSSLVPSQSPNISAAERAGVELEVLDLGGDDGRPLLEVGCTAVGSESALAGGGSDEDGRHVSPHVEVLVVLPFLTIALCNAVWTVTQEYVNDTHLINLFGYTAIDQLLYPFFLLLYLFVAFSSPRTKKFLLSDADGNTTLWGCMKQSWREGMENRGFGFGLLVLYRGVSNIRMMVGFYLVVTYDIVPLIYWSMTIRIVLSWMFTMVVALHKDMNSIQASEEEMETDLSSTNMVLKSIGCIFLLCGLYFL